MAAVAPVTPRAPAAPQSAPAAPAARLELPDTGIRRVPTVLQLEAVECGAAALAMVLAYHGLHVPLEQLRVECGVSRDGSKAGGLLRAARARGLVARGFRKEPREVAALPLPAIAFVNFNHFVVVEGFRDGRAWLNDPARGRRSVEGAQFDQAFTGVVLTFEPGPAFVRGGHAPSVLRSLAQYLDGFQLAVALVFMVGLTLVIPGLVLPYLLGRFVDQVLVHHLPGVAWTLLGGLALAALARSVLLLVQARLLTDTFARAVRSAAHRFVAHALALPMTFYAQRSPGEIAARVDLNERVAETLSSDLAYLALEVVTASFFLVLMVRLEATLALIVVGCLALELLAWRALARRTSEISQELSVQAGKLSGMATGALANIESIKAGGQESALFSKWVGLQVRFVNASTRAQRFMLTLGQAPAILGLAAQLAVLGLGALRIMQGGFTVGDLVAFQVLLAGFTAPVLGLFSRTQKLQTLSGDLARLDDVLHHDAEPGVAFAAAEDPVPAPRLAGRVEFRDVTFGYNRNEPPLLCGFSLTVRPGGHVALVGASGSGKSTVARLAAGLYAPWSGTILFDGQPRAVHERAHLAASVAFVDQDVVLFEGSVRENLTLWEPAADAALHAALADAALASEVAARPGGLDAHLQEGARNLSGGQRQRLEIARALVKSPAVLILDEATSALDAASEARVMAGLRARHVTCLVVAHRLSTVRDADEIVVLEGGRAVERGTHAELLADPHGRYAALVASEAAQ
jgi:NHLM bacteriocin system ABC transporter peptidase/ATP-binding protein